MPKPATTNKPDESKRDRHGFRGVPPPLTFSLATLADDALLDDLEVAAILRTSRTTVGSWRQQPDHPLKWFALPNGFVRYTVGNLKRYIDGGKPRSRKVDAAPKPAAWKRASPQRRTPRRPRAADAAAATEPSS